MLGNDINLIGRLTYDPKLFSTKSGKSCAIIGLACGHKDYTEFINVKAWEKAAETIVAYTKKGSQLAVNGHLHTKEKEVNGKTEYELEIIVDSFRFLDSKPKEELKEEALATVDDYLADQLPF